MKNKTFHKHDTIAWEQAKGKILSSDSKENRSLKYFKSAMSKELGNRKIVITKPKNFKIPSDLQ